jgi:hypothetical protein
LFVAFMSLHKFSFVWMCALIFYFTNVLLCVTRDPVKEEPTWLKPVPESTLSQQRTTKNLSP